MNSITPVRAVSPASLPLPSHRIHSLRALGPSYISLTTVAQPGTPQFDGELNLHARQGLRLVSSHAAAGGRTVLIFQRGS